MEYKCLRCGKNFKAPPKQKRKYCSIACSNGAKRKPLKITYPDGSVHYFKHAADVAKMLYFDNKTIGNWALGKVRSLEGYKAEYISKEEYEKMESEAKHE